MTYKDECQQNRANGRERGPRKMPWTIKAFRVITALVVFGVPLTVGVSALIGCGAYQAYKRTKRRP